MTARPSPPAPQVSYALPMAMHPLAGKPAPPSILVDLPRLVTAYYTLEPDPEAPEQRVVFGTSGHRGSALTHSFNEPHILAISQAICDYRTSQGTDGPLFLGKDTHALSEPAWATALEVLCENGVDVHIDQAHGWTPTPVISHAILTHNRGRQSRLADGIVITPSHNPPEDGGFKYNPPHGGPADTDATDWIAERANALLSSGLKGVRRMRLTRALQGPHCQARDYVSPYVADLQNVIQMQAIAEAKLHIGVDPMGGAGIAYWEPIADRYGLRIEVVNPYADATFRFMRVDKDGKIRMDCSSPAAMAGLVELKDRFDIAFGNDADYDRHGIVTPSHGLLHPNHYLAVCIDYLFRHRPRWRSDAAVGKTLVSSSLIDRVAAALQHPLYEVPVGFKWFVSGLRDGSCGFGGEESAGASFLRMDGSVWTTDKDGILLDLLAAEITATTGKNPGEHYDELAQRHGAPVYTRVDAPATAAQKRALKSLSPERVRAERLAGFPITQKLTHAPGNGAPIGGLKVATEGGWFAARPSGTEDVYKIYAESFEGTDHLTQLLDEARAIVSEALSDAAAG